MNTLKRDLKIALLLGGPGAEREVSLVSGNSVYDALCRAGFTDVTKVDVHGPDFRLPEGTELAYNIIHGTFGEDGTLQAILEERGVPYTGAGSRSSALCFKNPPEIPAGRLIDELGLKGACVRDACVSDVHANFIINRGHARARDITILIDMIRKEAMENRGIDLKSEAQVIGDRDPQF